MGLVDKTVLIGVDVYDHLNRDGHSFVCFTNAQMGEDASEDQHRAPRTKGYKDLQVWKFYDHD